MSTDSTQIAPPPASRLTTLGVISVALGLSALPLLLILPVDMDKVAQLLLLPAILCSLFTPGRYTLSAPVKGLLGALVLIVVLSTALSPFLAPALVTVAGWLLVGCGIFALHQIAANPCWLPWILRGIALGCVAGFFWVGLVIIQGNPGLRMPLYQHPRLFGMHMFAGVLASLILLIVQTRTARSYSVDIALAVLCWTAFFWSGSRAPLVGLIVGIVLWFLVADTAVRKRLALWVPLLLIVALSFSYLIRYPAYQLGWFRAVERSVNAADMNGLSSSRFVLWDKTWKQAADSPWLGRGPDGYRYLRPKLDGEQPHNFLLHWRLELGWPGMLCLLTLLGLCIITGLRNRDIRYRPWAVACAAGLAACTATACLDGIFYHVFILLPAVCLAAGCLQSPLASPETSCAKSDRLARWGVGAAIMVASVVLVFHSILLYRLVRGAPPHPRSSTAQMLRAFPSTTNGLIRWIEAWRAPLPNEALEWTLWAQTTAPYPAIYHEQAARLYIERNDLASTEAEYAAAVATGHSSAQRYLQKMLQLTRNARAEMLKTAPPAPPAAPAAPSP